MKLFEHVKRAFNNYLTRLAKSNQELFGSGAPDCCKLNRPAGSSVHRPHKHGQEL